jgi:hypothetical protein
MARLINFYNHQGWLFHVSTIFYHSLSMGIVSENGQRPKIAVVV